MEQEELRDVCVKRNGIGYLLQTGNNIERVTPNEIERLMESILRTHPGVPDGVTAAWNNRYEAVIEVSVYVGVVDMVVQPVDYTASILMMGVELSHLRTEHFPTPEEAVAEAIACWGKSLHVLPEHNQLNASRKQASDELLMLKAEEFCREQGITMEELWAEIANQGEQDETSDSDT